MIRLSRRFLIAVTFCAAAFCFEAHGVQNTTEGHWMLPSIGSSKESRYASTRRITPAS